MSAPKYLSTLALGGVALLVLTGCGASTPAAEAPATEAPATEAPATEAPESYYPVTVTDPAGNKVTIESADSIALTDNRFFQLAADWDLPVTVAPRDLMSPNNPLKDDEVILNTGTHREPDFEQIVAADPDLIINGYRYGGDTAEGVKAAAPGVPFVDTSAPDETTADEFVVQSLTLLGDIFNKKQEAADLITEFHDAVETAKTSYNPDKTVLGLVTNGKEINYSNPTDGRGASIFFSLLGLTPALSAEGTSFDQGDEVSLEALAGSNADILLVLDRAAAVGSGEGEDQSAIDLIKGSPALAELPAVKNDSIYVMPADYYLTEDVYAYISVLNGLKEVFDAQK